MTFKIITTQPGIYDSFFKTGLIGRGIEKNIIAINIHNLHDFATDRRKTIDDTPYGGGAGMVLRVDVIDKAIKEIRKSKIDIGENNTSKTKTILLTPQGKRFTQADAKRLSKEKELILISGRFEGYDERIRDLVDEEISIGDYVLTSGDLPAMVVIDAISRQIPGFIKKQESIENESFSLDIVNCKLKIENCLEYPQYTKPEIYKGKKVPKILLSGNHGEIAKWRQNEAYKKTAKRN